MIPPLHLRQLKAQMTVKALSLEDVSKLSEVPYSTCSEILNGRTNHPTYLAQIERAITKAPMPKEGAKA